MTKYIVVKTDGSNEVTVVTEDSFQELKDAMIALNGFSGEDWFNCIVGEVVKDMCSYGDVK